jgi:hypothetical protein
MLYVKLRYCTRGDPSAEIVNDDRGGDPEHQASRVSRRIVEDSLAEHLESETAGGRNAYELDPNVVDRDVVAMKSKIESFHVA